MTMRDLVLANRSTRRFDESRAVSREELIDLVDLARLCPSGGNMQPLKYLVSRDAATNAKIFPHVRWAAALKDWDGPAEGERPTAYVVILLDTSVKKAAGCDHGIAAQTLLLAAAEKGLAGCMMGAIDRPALIEALNIPPQFEIALVVALGKSGEKIVIDELPPGGATAYTRDEQSVHHVPKRPLDEVLVEFG